jgi:hypothetical protein
VAAREYYLWAMRRALDGFEGAQLAGSIRLRAEQMILAMERDEETELRALCAEVEKGFLRGDFGLARGPRRLIELCWGALALHTGYRTGAFYVDTRLLDFAEAKAHKNVLRAIGAGRTDRDAENLQRASGPRIDGARRQARSAEAVLIAAQREHFGCPAALEEM